MKQLIKFRTGHHHFPVGTGIWNNLDYCDRKCQLCRINETPDKYHYRMSCTF